MFAFFPASLGTRPTREKREQQSILECEKRSKRQADRAGRKAFYEPEFTYGKYAKSSRKFLIDIKNLSRRSFCIFHSELPRIGGSKKLARACFYWSWQIGWASITRIPKYRCSRFSRPPWARGQRGKNANSNLFWNVKRDQKDRPTEQAAKHSTSPNSRMENMQKALANSWLISEFIAKSFCIFHSELPRIGGSKKLARACFYWSWQIGWASITRIPKYRCSRFPGLLGHAANEEKREQQSILECEKIKKTGRPSRPQSILRARIHVWKICKKLSQILDWYQNLSRKAFCISIVVPRIGGSKKLARACFYWSWQISWASITRIPKYRCSRFPGLLSANVLECEKKIKDRPTEQAAKHSTRNSRMENMQKLSFWNVKNQKDRPTEQAAKHSQIHVWKIANSSRKFIDIKNLETLHFP